MTHREEDLYWTLNQTIIELAEKSSKEGIIKIKLKTNTPNFMTFEVKIDNENQWQQADETFIWELHKGNNILLARAVNMFGIAGPPATVKTFYIKH